MTNSYPDVEVKSQLQITFHEDVSPDQRLAAERSVATFIARTAEAAAQRNAAETELAKLTDALTAPFVKLIEENPEAMKAVESLRTKQLFDPETLVPRQDAVLLLRPRR